MRNRFILVTALLVVAAFTSAAANLQRAENAAAVPREKSGEEAEARLLRAELLELSAGDLKSAMEAYRELAADAAAPEAVRLRARLYLARCHRKLGELEAARKILEDLLAHEELDRRIRREAQSHLEEIGRGKAANPEFDWLGELARNPEIRARIFDLAMDLAAPELAPAARRQLAALGHIAHPVLEKLLGTSTDPRHRQEIALLLVRTGRYEYLKDALQPEWLEAMDPGAFGNLALSLPALSDEARGRFKEALEKLSDDPRLRPYRAALFLSAGVLDGLEENLEILEQWVPLPTRKNVRFAVGTGNPSWRWLWDLPRSLAARYPVVAETLAKRIPDPKLPLEVLRGYVKILEEHTPGALGPEQLATWFVRDPVSPASYADKAGPYFRRMEEREGWEALQRMILERPQEGLLRAVYTYLDETLEDCGEERAGKRAALIVKSLAAALEQGITFKSGPSRFQDPTWAGLPEILWRLARRYESAVPHFAAFLERILPRGEFVFRKTPFDPQDGAEDGADRPPKPSEAYYEAMIRALRFEHPLAHAVALLEIAEAPRPLSETAYARIVELARTGDLHVREFALHALLRHLEPFEERAPVAAELLAREFEGRLDWPRNVRRDARYGAGPGRAPAREDRTRPSPETLAVAYQNSPAGSFAFPYRRRLFGPQGWFRRYLEGIRPEGQWVLAAAGPEKVTRLYPYLLDLAQKGRYIRFHQAIARLARDTKELSGAWEHLLAHLESIDHPALVRSLLEEIGSLLDSFSKLPDPRLGKFLERVFRAQAFDPDDRALAFWLRSRAGDGMELLFDVPADDPVFEPLFTDYGGGLWRDVISEYDPPAVRRLLQIGLEGGHPAVWESWLRHGNPTQEVFAGELKRAAYHPDPNVRAALADLIVKEPRGDMVDLFLRLAGDRDIPGGTRISLLEVLQRIADEKSLVPIGRLLDDPVLEVREAALRTLQGIRAALEERGAWKKLLERLEKLEESGQSSG